MTGYSSHEKDMRIGYTVPFVSLPVALYRLSDPDIKNARNLPE